MVGQYFLAFIEPWGTLWFIYHLALFLVVARLLKSVPWQLVWLGAAALEIAPIHTGSVLIDEFAGRFVYFYTGYIFASHVFRFADEIARRLADRADRPGAVGDRCNGLLVFNGLADLPLVSLSLGMAGAMAVVAVSVFLAQTRAAAASPGSASIRSSSISPSSCRWR